MQEVKKEASQAKDVSLVTKTLSSRLFWKIMGILLAVLVYVGIIYVSYRVCYKGMFGLCMFVLGGLTCSILTYKFLKRK